LKNVAIINTCDFGSTGKIAYGLYQHFRDEDFNCSFIYGRGKKVKNEQVFRMEGQFSIYCHYAVTKLIGADGYGSAAATRKLIRKLKQKEIDTVYIVSLHGHYLNENLFFSYLAEEKIKVIYIMIDEYAYLGGCDYSGSCHGYEEKCADCPRNRKNVIARKIKASNRRYMSKYMYYRKLKDPVFVGPEYTIQSAEKTGLLNGLETRILDESINTSLYCPRDTKQFRQELSIPEDKTVIVCVAPFSYGRKGVRYFYELAKQMQGNDQYIFVHVGYDGKEDTFPSNMIVKGFESNQETLSMYYSLADLFVFPSLQDTMPNACLEALSCGTPLLCFNISGMPYIANEEVADFVEAENVGAMKAVILKTGRKDKATEQKCREYALSRYDSRKYFDKLKELGKEEKKADN